MEWTVAAQLAEMEEGQGVRLCHAGRVVAVFLVEGEVYALDDLCSHAEASLSEGEVFDTEVECPLHGAAFDLASGEALTSACHQTGGYLSDPCGTGEGVGENIR